MEAIAEKLKKIILKHKPELAADKITSKTSIKELGIDSLDFIEVIFAIENEFGVDLPADKLANLHTVGDLIAAFQSTGH